ncbi:MAG: SusC/RagA family TonB-linked outer membrane protein, partial [Alistipes sp.]|nr:SusC/RagA family TonB-linked outer membrane protein [Alistipes sp.]
MVRKLVLSLVAVLGVAFMALAQNQQVSGTVTDNHGNPVVGATVMVDGTNQGTTTGADGKFVLSAPANGTLTVSFVGYEDNTVQIAGKSSLKIALQEDTHAIDDVIVVAYGTAKKESFTGSVSTVSGETLKKMQVSNVSKALEGMVPGMQVASQSGQPGSSADVSIRGIGSINAGSSPLYIVDGAPYSGSIAAINPADIESISVSKDAVSTALYGSRAANGLIIITTKQGSAMRNQVTFDARVGVNSRGISNYDVMETPEEYIPVYFQYLVNTEGSGEAAANIIGAKLGYNPFIGNNGVFMTADGQLVSTERRYYDSWEDEVFANGMRQEYNVSISGGNQKMKHYMSVGYLNDEGILPKSDYSRYSARANASYKVNDNIDLYGNLSYSHGVQNAQNISSLSNFSNSFMFVQQIAPIYPVYAYDQEGQLILDKNGKRQYDFGDGEFGETRPWGKAQNPAATDAANLNETLTDQLSGRAGINISPLEGLKLSANVSYDMVNQANATFMTPSFGDAVTYNGTGDRVHQRNFSLTSNQLISYTKTLGDHGFSVMAGHES